MPTRTRAVGYIRVSTEKQAEAGISLEAQRAKLEGYAQLYECDIVELIEEAGGSAKSLARPGLQRALQLLDAGEANALLVVKLDRLTRRVADLGALIANYFEEGAANLLSVEERIDTRSASGRLVLNILASVSQWEREAIVERTRTAMKHLKAQGKRAGTVPFGYRVAPDGETLIEDKHEQAIITAARAQQGKSLRIIAAELAKQGFTARTGRPFAPAQVQRMLAKEAP